MKVTIKTVESKSDLRKFASYPNVLYKDCPQYVPQMVYMEMDALNPKKNHSFEVCTAEYYLALDEKGKVVGRVAAIINNRYNEKVGQHQCRIGWIDFVDDYDVFCALMKAAEGYAIRNGMDTLAGPMGFLEFDLAGVVTYGYDRLPTCYGKYNHPYYPEFFERYGFQQDADYVEYLVQVIKDAETTERYKKASDLIKQRYELHEAPLRRTKDVYPYLDGVFEVMNQAYNKLHGYSIMSKGQTDDLKKNYLSHVNVDFVSIVLDKDEKVIGFGLAIPNLSKAMQKAHGHMLPFGWYHILHALSHNDTLDAMLIAVSEEYENKGIPGIIFNTVLEGAIKHDIKYVESTRELEDNMNVRNLWGKMNHELIKRARSYTKKID